MYPSIFNSFQVIRTASAKNRRFHVPQPTLLFRLETPLRLSRNMLHGWKDNLMLAKPLTACTLSIFNSFRVIRCLSQCVSSKIAIFTTFLFPLGMLLGNHAKCCMDGKRIWCLQIASQHVPICLQQFPRYSNRKCKNRRFHVRSPDFCFPWRRPCDYHAICCTDGKSIQCLPNSCSMYLSIFNSFRIIWCLSQCVTPKIAIFTTFLFPMGTPLGQSR